jgi:glutathione peroxidase
MQAAARALRCQGSAVPVRPARRGHSVQIKALFGSSATQTAGSDFYNFKVKDIDGRATNLSQYKGKVVLVVNLASACGFTPQYSELQELYNKYQKQGLVVLGFPCNQFGSQEPGSNSDIKTFAKKNYGVTFPLMSKVDVNGSNADPVFDWLKKQKGGFITSDIKWNFSKFLLDKDGKVVNRYGSTTTPAQLEAEIQKLL